MKNSPKEKPEIQPKPETNPLQPELPEIKPQPDKTKIEPVVPLPEIKPVLPPDIKTP